MFNRLSEISMIAYGAVAAGFLVAAGGVYALNDAEAAAPAIPTEAAVDLARFEGQTGADANVMAQVNRSYQFPITDGDGGQSYLVPLFTAADDALSNDVSAAVLVDDLVAFDAMLAENVLGNARLGELYAIAGNQIDAGAWATGIAQTLEMAELNVVGELILIKPTMPSFVAAGLPLMPIAWAFAAMGLAVLAIGIAASRRGRQESDVVADRFQNLQGIVVPAE